MRRHDPRLWLAGLASIAVTCLLAIPNGHLGATSAQRQEALVRAPDIDVCRMLDDFLSDRSGDLPMLDLDPDPPDNETIAIRHPARARARCSFDGNEAQFGPERVEVTTMQMTVTTMSSNDEALSRLSAFVAQTDLGPGAVRSIEDDRATLGGFLARDHSAWQVVEHYVLDSYHVGFVVTFDEDNQQISGRAVIDAIDAIVDHRLTPDDYLLR